MESGNYPSSSSSSSSSSMESPHEEEKMDVYLKINRTVAFKVNKSSKIKDLKSLFYKKEGVEENLQELFYYSQSLKDEMKLVDYGIQSYSTLNLYVRGNSTKLFVNIPPDDVSAHHRTIEIEPTIHDTIKNIKYLIQAKEDGIKPDSYALFYNAEQLEENKTLASLNIPNESVLHLVFIPSDSLSVSIELPNGEVLKLEVKYMHRIRDLKQIILSRVPSEAKRQDLSYAGTRLDDDKTLAFYDIKPNSTLMFMPCIGTFQIFVMLMTSSRITLTVNPKDTILDVKKLIGSRMGWPKNVYRLIYDGKLLEEKRDLASYNIKKESSLYMNIPRMPRF